MVLQKRGKSGVQTQPQYTKYSCVFFEFRTGFVYLVSSFFSTKWH